MRYYTGVGSRSTPRDIQDIMTALAKKLQAEGWTLRSGGADGADAAFERGAGTRKEIFRASDATPEAMEIARRHHPAWDRCSFYARRLHGRNAFQVLGRSLDAPSGFLVCWTPDGCTGSADRSVRTGGTGTAIAIAESVGVPVFNLQREDHRNRICRWK